MKKRNVGLVLSLVALTSVSILVLRFSAHADESTSSADIPSQDSQSCTLGELIPLCQNQLNQAPPPGDLSGVSPLRQNVVNAAASQIGTVADARGADCNKQGWQNLADFYRVSWRRELTPWEIHILKNYSTLGGQTKLGEWCGIFALWAVKTGARQYAETAEIATPDGPPPAPEHGRQADFRGPYMDFVTWHNGRGVYGIPEHFGHSGVQPGDIVIFRGDLSHHAIVERVIGDKIYTIDGNQYCQMIARKVRDLSEVVAFYPVD